MAMSGVRFLGGGYLRWWGESGPNSSGGKLSSRWGVTATRGLWWSDRQWACKMELINLSRCFLSVPQEVANVYHGGCRTPSFNGIISLSLTIWFSATMKLLTWEIWQLPGDHPLTRNDQPTLYVEHSKHSPAAWCQSGCSAEDGEGKWLGGFTSPADTCRNRASKPLWSISNSYPMFIGCFKTSKYIYIFLFTIHAYIYIKLNMHN